MTSTDPGVAVLVPPRERLHGPLTRRALRRTSVLLALVAGLGLLPAVLDWSAEWKAFGIGLLFPGAGFLYTSDPVFFLLVLVVLPRIALIQFQFRADNVTPVVLTLGTAALATLRTGTGLWDWVLWVVPLFWVVVIGAVRLGRRRAFRRARALGTERNRYLVDIPAVAPAAATARPARVDEHSEEDLAMLRGFLDRALQPLDRWDGFDWSQQFSMAAMRYQLNWMQWSLALAQYTRTPAFTGYLSGAQANLIQRMTERRVWSYWRLENGWGNLDPDPDPVRRDNIMFSGYLALMLATLASASGERPFEAAESLTFRWNDRRAFAYRDQGIIDAVLDNFRATPWGAFPCEPGLNFAVCNAIGMLGIQAWDRVEPVEDLDSLVARFRQSVDEEYTTAAGDIITIISRRYGYSMRFAKSSVSQAGTAFFLRPVYPEISARLWAVLRRELIGVTADGHYQPLAKGKGYDEIDLGNNKKSPVTRLAFFSSLAREMGDDEAYAALVRSMDEALAPATRQGARWYTGASTVANAMAGLGRFGREGGWYDLVAKGRPDGVARGPRLRDVAYPDVQVALATTDGEALELVLRPGDGPTRAPVVVDRLSPGRRYAVEGNRASELTAGDDGTAVIEVELTGRTELRLAPSN